MNSSAPETRVFFLFLFILFAASATSRAQKESPSLTDRQKAIVKSIYSKAIEVPDEFINGREYEPYYRASVFKPLLLPEKKKSVTLLTLTRKYDNLNLQYDTFLDELFYTDTSRMINSMYPLIALNKDVARGFNFHCEDDTLYFTRFNEGMGLNDGYYEVAYKGSITYLIRHRSVYFTRDAVPNYRYSPVNLLSRGDEFRVVKSRRDLLKFLNYRSGKIRDYLHRNRIKVRKITKDQMIKILSLYASDAENR